MNENSLDSKFINPPFWLGNRYVNSDFVFDTLIEGDCNKLARKCALLVSEKPAVPLFNPLILYGSSGLGKTHLLQAIFNNHKDKHAKNKALYLRAPDFTENLVHAIKHNLMDEFIDHTTNQDILLLDDIQYVERREKTQDIILQIIDNLLSKGSQVVISTSILPEYLRSFNDGLLSQLLKGMLVKLEMPDSQTILEILRLKARQYSTEIPDAMLTKLLSRKYNSISDVEGHLKLLIADIIFNE